MVTARMIGGRDDGREMSVDCHPDRPPFQLCIAQPMPLIGVAEWADQLGGPPTTAPACPVATYRYAERIAEDGARLYTYEGTTT